MDSNKKMFDKDVKNDTEAVLKINQKRKNKVKCKE